MTTNAVSDAGFVWQPAPISAIELSEIETLGKFLFFDENLSVPGKMAYAACHAPEVAEYVNDDELGNLGLTPDEEAAVVAFMKTLSDGWQTE